MKRNVKRFLRSRFVRDVKLLFFTMLVNPMSWWIYPNLWRNFIKPALIAHFF